jgi:hypothetical protein
MAAKSYALAASYLAYDTGPAQHLIGLAFAAFANYHQGALCSAAELDCDALRSHRPLAERPMDFDQHGWLYGAFFELTQVRSLARKAGHPYRARLEGAAARDGLDQSLDELLDVVLGDHPLGGSPSIWATMSRGWSRIWGRPPLDDTTEIRRVRFECLGVTWTVVFRNRYADVVVGERFAAALQIALAHLADDDLNLLPMGGTVYVTALPTSAEFNAAHALEPAPEESRLSVSLPASE